jgi:hypothetical protein
MGILHGHNQFETRISSEFTDLKSMIKANTHELKKECYELRADIAVLTNSHEYLLWIGGGLATICISMFGLCSSILLPSFN